ncbi:hypothetical protein IQ217_18495 [Synechocystis salina LEGE 00031]|uniref:Uncharacterized protein n=1 Tax=Synechocystis salina LEGE 00031 TaxID=1828736 RepID=A0ABR9VWP0_9SYNC|nr:hypothetical protein [Synechocystis salina]MBE9255777.1 hypothetical protein [Synechocystis salina LEGE 00031]
MAALKSRPESRSELCFPFRYKNVAIGTINFESGIVGAFDSDIDFLILLKNFFEETYASYFSLSDTIWMQQLSQYADPLHELSNYLATPIFNERQKEILRSLFFNRVLDDEQSKNTNMNELMQWFHRWVRSHFDQETDDIVDKIESILEFNGTPNSTMSRAVFDTIRSIIRNLVVNIVSYSYVDLDKIIVSMTARYRTTNDNDNDNIRIRLKSFGIFDDEELDSMCVSPIQREYDLARPEHQGMYLIGLLTRSVGGYVNVCSTQSGSETVIEFVVPK